MIPARMGSQRLHKKNLRRLHGVTLIERAIEKCKKAKVFDEIWVNSEDITFKKYAEQNEVNFHRRPAKFSNNNATSEDYIEEFLKIRPCDLLVQVHSIAPLLTVSEISEFVEAFKSSDDDVLLSFTSEQIECAYQNVPINFTFKEKTNSQLLKPVQRIVWSISGWRRSTFLEASQKGKCSTYAGKIGYFEVNQLAGHVIKNEEDLSIAEALLPLIQ
jgi:CMP-N-acetylneuraminic acid synthetase